MNRTILFASLFCVGIGSAQATTTDQAISICAAVAGITQDALEDMQQRRIPLEKTAIYGEIKHDPNMVKSLQSAVAMHKRGVSIPQVVDAWAQGCLQALTGADSQPATAARGTRVQR